MTKADLKVNAHAVRFSSVYRRAYKTFD